MKKTLFKNIELGVLFGLVCAIVLSFAKFEVRCDELRHNVLRLHIIANSDSEADQALKLTVRDRILQTSLQIFENCDNVDSAITLAQNELDTITETANEAINQNGFDYNATVSVDKAYFDTRVYDDFTLPAGEYNSIIVNLGEGGGKNWWCVVFPCVCVPTATDAKLSDSVSNGAAETAENAQNYKIKFKTAEIYEDIKNFFSKKS